VKTCFGEVSVSLPLVMCLLSAGSPTDQCDTIWKQRQRPVTSQSMMPTMQTTSSRLPADVNNVIVVNVLLTFCLHRFTILCYKSILTAQWMCSWISDSHCESRFL